MLEGRLSERLAIRWGVRVGRSPGVAGLAVAMGCGFGAWAGVCDFGLPWTCKTSTVAGIALLGLAMIGVAVAAAQPTWIVEGRREAPRSAVLVDVSRSMQVLEESLGHWMWQRL